MNTPHYKCAECGALVIVDNGKIVERGCKDHDDKAVVLDMGSVALRGAAKMANG